MVLVLVLDTDHLVEFDEASAAGTRLKRRLLASGEVCELRTGWIKPQSSLFPVPPG